MIPGSVCSQPNFGVSAKGSPAPSVPCPRTTSTSTSISPFLHLNDVQRGGSLAGRMCRPACVQASSTSSCPESRHPCSSVRLQVGRSTGSGSASPRFKSDGGGADAGSRGEAPSGGPRANQPRRCSGRPLYASSVFSSASDARTRASAAASWPYGNAKHRRRLPHMKGSVNGPAKLPLFDPVFPPLEHGRPDHGVTARTADRAVLIELRRFLAVIRVPL